MPLMKIFMKAVMTLFPLFHSAGVPCQHPSSYFCSFRVPLTPVLADLIIFMRFVYSWQYLPNWKSVFLVERLALQPCACGALPYACPSGEIIIKSFILFPEIYFMLQKYFHLPIITLTIF